MALAISRPVFESLTRSSNHKASISAPIRSIKACCCIRCITGRGEGPLVPPVRPVAIVTGGTRGIGLGIARALATDGWNLALSGVRAEETVGDVVAALRDVGADVLYRATDVGATQEHAGFLS